MKKRWLVCTLLMIVMISLLTTMAFAGTGDFSGTGGAPHPMVIWVEETVELTEAGDKSGDGWDWNASERTLTLENAAIGCQDGCLFDSNIDYKVVLKGINSLVSAGGAALSCDGDLTVTGDGLMQIFAQEGFSIIYADNITIRDTTVRIFGRVSDGICAEEDLEVENSELYIDFPTWQGVIGDAVTISDSEIWIRWTEDCGVMAREGLTISDSEITITRAGDAGLNVDEGNLTISDSEITITRADVGLDAVEGDLTISDSKITITRADYCGVRIDEGDLTIQGSALRVETSQYGMRVWDNVIVEDSEVYLFGSRNAFFSANGKLNFESDAPVRGALFKSQELTEAEIFRAKHNCCFHVDGKTARVLQIKPSSSAFALIAAIESVQNAQSPFADVTAQTEYYDAIAKAYNRGLMGGVSATQFAPNDTLTRAMVWTVLARTNGVNTEIGETWDSAGRDWAMREKVSDGTDPNGAVTVEELITMAWRNVGSPYRVADLGNADVSEWAVEAMRWAYETGILSREINPKSNATRALTAHVLTAK